VALGADALLGAEGQGHATLERAIGRGILALCAEALGAMEAAKAATLDYLRTRKQFGILDRQLPGAAAPHGRPAAGNRAGALGRHQRGGRHGHG
jgi:alkylation response protein AidB-like acyl-CoA dehydrogenase